MFLFERGFILHSGTLQALMSLMKLLDISDYYQEALNCLNKLMALDPFRINYYRDLGLISYFEIIWVINNLIFINLLSKQVGVR